MLQIPELPTFDPWKAFVTPSLQAWVQRQYDWGKDRLGRFWTPWMKTKQSELVSWTEMAYPCERLLHWLKWMEVRKEIHTKVKHSKHWDERGCFPGPSTSCAFSCTEHEGINGKMKAQLHHKWKWVRNVRSYYILHVSTLQKVFFKASQQFFMFISFYLYI